MDTIHNRARSNLSFRDSAYACRALVVHILNGHKPQSSFRELELRQLTHLRLYTTQTAQLLVPWLFPLGNEARTKPEHELTVKGMMKDLMFRYPLGVRETLFQ